MGKISYNRLSPAEQEAYRRLEAGFGGYALSVDMTGVHPDTDFTRAILACLGDNPQVIYFDRTQFKVASGGFGRREVKLLGAPSLSRINKMQGELEAAVRRALGEIESMNPITDYDRLTLAYEYIQDHVAYDDGELAASARLGESLNPQAHNAYGALVEGMAVCDGMSSALGLLISRMGYEITVVSGSAVVETTLPTEHAWNILRLPDGSHCHLDVTWDARRRRVMGEYSYEYFCVTDEDVGPDHDWKLRDTPPCDNQGAGFYRRSRCYANNLSQLEEIFMRLAKSKAGVVRARLAPGIPVPEPQQEYLTDLLMRSAAKVGRRDYASVMWNRNARCFFGKFRGSS